MDDIAPPRSLHIPLQPAPPEPRPTSLREHSSFKTPEEVGKSEAGKAPAPSVDLPPQAGGQRFAPPPRLHHRLLKRWHALSRKRKVLFLSGLLLIVVGLAGGVVALTGHTAKPQPAVVSKPKPKPVAKPTTVPSTLTGLPVDPSVNQRPVTGVMIENSDDARPQSGLDQAGVVFEAVAEGGITRFLALFQDTAPAYIGPVRSLRPYYLQWCMGFDCSIAHVGGSPDALADVKTWGAKDLDQSYNSNFYQRISSRYAPHNVYTSIAQLNQLEASKGFGASNYSGFARKAAQPAKTVTAGSIDMSPSYADFASHYDYNPAANNYTRNEAGAPHVEVDAAGHQTPITPKVVIAMIVPQSQGALDSTGAYYTDYAAIGSGQVFVFQDGIVTTGTWSKTSNAAQITFTNSSGKPLKLDAGQTWITALGSASSMSYKP